MDIRNQYIYVEPELYTTDVLAMLRSFFPEKNLKVAVPESRPETREEAARDGYFCTVKCDGHVASVEIFGRQLTYPEAPEAGEQLTDKTFKKGLGAFLYRILQEETGRSLPWGNLNGVRPTKPAFRALQAGKTREEILESYGREHFVSREKAELAVDIAGRELGLLRCFDHDGAGVSAGYSLYIGIPFCPSTCLYCSFTSFPIAAYRGETDRYVDCLLRELEGTVRLMGGKAPDTVYVGGGTPTTLSAMQMDRLLGELASQLDLTDIAELTVEAGRADSITPEALEVMKRRGVTRISINAQTMQQRTLDVIGRRASVSQVREAYAAARACGFDNINMDLILGLPGETAADVADTMEQVQDLRPESLTVHSLAIKRASALSRIIEEKGMPVLENTAQTMEIAARGAAQMGLLPYYLYRQKNMSGNFENVGYALPGKYGYYNVLMMEELQSILALGAGVVSKSVLPGPPLQIRRCENVKDVRLYMDMTEDMVKRKEELFA
ncbi:MAG: coproporphyrinogen dehydrogenase HemZ [Lachnospiraceae bacterium]|nr:coproporphyrinogen dehydrogenase HemZ [Lachnospiraceae bacterium]